MHIFTLRSRSVSGMFPVMQAQAPGIDSKGRLLPGMAVTTTLVPQNGGSPEHRRRQPVTTNKNVEWINAPGAWTFITALIILGWLLACLFVDSGLAWTYVHLGHGVITYYLLHWNKGSPVQMDQVSSHACMLPCQPRLPMTPCHDIRLLRQAREKYLQQSPPYFQGRRLTKLCSRLQLKCCLRPAWHCHCRTSVSRDAMAFNHMHMMPAGPCRCASEPSQRSCALQGKYDGMTFWEQLDDGVQNTNNRKFLTLVPVVLFLLATHGTDYR